MTTPTELPKTDDPLAALKAGVDAHARLAAAQRAAAAELPPPVEQPPAPAEELAR